MPVPSSAPPHPRRSRGRKGAAARARCPEHSSGCTRTLPAAGHRHHDRARRAAGALMVCEPDGCRRPLRSTRTSGSSMPVDSAVKDDLAGCGPSPASRSAIRDGDRRVVRPSGTRRCRPAPATAADVDQIAAAAIPRAGREYGRRCAPGRHRPTAGDVVEVVGSVRSRPPGAAASARPSPRRWPRAYDTGPGWSSWPRTARNRRHLRHRGVPPIGTACIAEPSEQQKLAPPAGGAQFPVR